MWYNPIMQQVLRSPLHGLLSGNMMLIKFTGRKSGKPYSVPTNYVRDGDDLWVVSLRRRTWWRNLRGGTPVAVCLCGQELKGTAEVVDGELTVAVSLYAYLQRAPQAARYLDVQLDPAGQPQRDDVARAAQTRVMLRIHLAPERVAA